MDWMLPMLGGIEMLRALRRFSDVYIILLTPRVEEADRIVGLSTGTDDYLAAKIRAPLYSVYAVT